MKKFVALTILTALLVALPALAEDAETVLYADDLYAYTIRYPADWTPADGTVMEKAKAQPPELSVDLDMIALYAQQVKTAGTFVALAPDWFSSVTIVCDKSGAPQDGAALAASLSEIAAELTDSSDEVVIVDRGSAVARNESFAQMIARVPFQGRDVYMKLMLTCPGNTLYAFSFILDASDEAALDEMIAQCDGMLESFTAAK